MPNTLPVPGVQVARSNSAASLSDLAEVIRAEHAAVVRASNDVLHHVLAAGRFLIEAQGIVPKGQWAGWVSRSCEVSYRTARRYMQLTRAYEATGHSVASDLVDLSLRGLMRALALSKQPDKARGRHSRPAPATLDKLSPQAWANASPAERARFVSAIGWRSLAEAIPPDWPPVIREWLQTLSKEVAITIDRNGIVLPDDLSIPTFLRHEQPKPTLASAESVP